MTEIYKEQFNINKDDLMTLKISEWQEDLVIEFQHDTNRHSCYSSVYYTVSEISKYNIDLLIEYLSDAVIKTFQGYNMKYIGGIFLENISIKISTRLNHNILIQFYNNKNQLYIENSLLIPSCKADKICVALKSYLEEN